MPIETTEIKSPTIEEIIAERKKHNEAITSPTAITPQSMESANKIILPEMIKPSISTEADIAKLQTQADIENKIKMEQDIRTATQTQEQKGFGTLTDEMKGIKESLLGESAITSQLQKEKLAPIETDLTSIKNQMEALSATHQNYLKTIENKPITMQSIYGQQAKENADYNAQILTLSAQSNILMNNYALAEKQIASAVNEKFGPQKELLAVKQSQLDALKASGTLDKAEKIQADALSRYYAQENQKIEDKKALATNIASYTIKAHEAGITDKNVLDQIMKAPDIQTAANLIAQYAPVKKDLQFISGTANQQAGYFDKNTGKFVATGGGGGGGMPTTPSQYVVGENPVVDSWATRIQAGQAKITEIPAAQASLRNAVSVALMAMGNDTEGKPTVTEMGKEALKTATNLKDKLTKRQGTSAIGKSGFLATFGYGLIPGTQRADFVTTFQSLKDQLALEGVKYLKGQGQVSDAERALLASAVTKLNLSQSETEFGSTLNTIINKLSGTSSENTLMVVTAPDGTQVEITD